MSISVIQEMNQSGYPLDAVEHGRLLEMTQFTAEKAASTEGAFDARTLGLIVRRNPAFQPLEPLLVVAGSLGVRAQRQGLDISSGDDDGFRFAEGLEVTQLKAGKTLASQDIDPIRLRPGQHSGPIPTILGFLSSAVERASSGGSPLTPLPVLTGYAILARESVMAERQAA